MKKRVLVFVPEFPVISETFIERELTELAKSPQIELAVYSLKKGKGEISETLVPYVRYIHISVSDIVRGKIKFLLSSTHRFFEALKTVGLKNYYLFAKSLGYAKVFSEFNPDIIYAHFMSQSSTIGLISSILLGTEFAVSAHARDILEYPDLPIKKLKKSKFITICNKNAYEQYLALCKAGDSNSASDTALNTNKVHLLYHGIPDLSLEFGKAQLNSISNINENSVDLSATKASNVKKLLTIGRLVEKKGSSYLLDAFSLVLQRFPDYTIELNIIGDGPLLESLKEKASKLNLKNKVFFKGGLPFSETREYLKNTDIYVQPSINVESGDADGIPNTLIEAAMAQIPIVTTDAGSIPEFLDNTNSVITTQNDSTSLAGGMELLIKQEGVAQTIAERAYLKAKQMFDIKNNVAKIEELLIK